MKYKIINTLQSVLPSAIFFSFFFFLFFQFFSFSTGLLQDCSAGFPLRSCWTIRAHYVQGSYPMSSFRFSPHGCSGVRTPDLLITRRTLYWLMFCGCIVAFILTHVLWVYCGLHSDSCSVGVLWPSFWLMFCGCIVAFILTPLNLLLLTVSVIRRNLHSMKCECMINNCKENLMSSGVLCFCLTWSLGLTVCCDSWLGLSLVM